MTGEATIELASRQQRLLQRSAALRTSLAHQGTVLAAPMATADRVRAGARWLVRQRGWVAGGLVVVLVLRPRRAWRVARFGWWLWRSSRRLQPWLAALGLVGTARAGTRRG